MSREVQVRFCESRAVRSRPATHLLVLVHGTRNDALAVKATVAQMLAEELKMTLSEEKTLVTHLDDGLDFLGFRIRRRTRGEGRHVVLTYPSKQALAAVMHKTRKATGRSATSLALADVLAVVNPILRGWAAYFRYGASKRTFSYLGWFAWWRVVRWLRRKHPRLTWKQVIRRYGGVDQIEDDGLVLYNPAKMTVERYRYRGTQIGTPYNIDVVDPAGARFRHTNHDDMAFVGKVSELVS